ncbi:MAG TPA: DUF4201 domain-containing protein [Acidisarcina sp.]|nr:DUF4201 domain-containing protein [Acidisarcina sp.]
MPTLALGEPEQAIAIDDFQALEQRVLRTVQLLKSEREQRAAAEERASTAEQRLEESNAMLASLEAELTGLRRERDGVRNRVERLLTQLDDLAV